MKIEILVCVSVAIILISLFFTKYKPYYKGYLGEREVNKRLKKLSRKKYKVINNLLVQTDKGSCQIDHIVVSIYGVFVIETKNYSGKIYGAEWEEQWRQVLWGKTELLRNPIKQNAGHIKVLKYKIPKLKGYNIISIVAFTKRGSLKVNTDTTVIYTKKIKRKIKKYRQRVFTVEEVETIYEKLVGLNTNSFVSRKKHVSNVKRNLKISNKYLRKNRCPRCGSRLKKRRTEYGKIFGCKNYPECTYRRLKIES